MELQTARLLAKIAPVELVTYRQREPDHPFFDDLLRAEPRNRLSQSEHPLWIVSWGFDVPKLLRRLRGRPCAYHAHSSGYGFGLPPGVPVLAVSRNTLGYWGHRAPRNPLFLVPNALEPQWLERGERFTTASDSLRQRRPIDVLIQQRKSSIYVLDRLVPALRERGLRVEVQSDWVDDLVGLFNSAAVYIYDSADYWNGRGVSEGFGLPPVEALACGCAVFSSLNHALADSLDPGVMAHQIGCGTLEADVERIAAAVASPAAWQAPQAGLEAMLVTLQESVLLERWQRALLLIDRHWQSLLRDNVEPLTALPPWRLRCRQLVQSFRRRLKT